MGARQEQIIKLITENIQKAKTKLLTRRLLFEASFVLTPKNNKNKQSNTSTPTTSCAALFSISNLLTSLEEEKQQQHHHQMSCLQVGKRRVKNGERDFFTSQKFDAKC